MCPEPVSQMAWPHWPTKDPQKWQFLMIFATLDSSSSLKWDKFREGTAMILRKSVLGLPMGIFDGHIGRFYDGFCQTSLALRTTV